MSQINFLFMCIIGLFVYIVFLSVHINEMENDQLKLINLVARMAKIEGATQDLVFRLQWERVGGRVITQDETSAR